jgi:hypothetical protein
MAADVVLRMAYEKAKARLELCFGDVKNHFLAVDLLRSQHRADSLEKTTEMLRENVKTLTDEFRREIETLKKLAENRTERRDISKDDLRHRLLKQRQEIENGRNRLLEEIAQTRDKGNDLERGAPYEVLDIDEGRLTASTPLHGSTPPSVGTKPGLRRTKKKRDVVEGDEKKLGSMPKKSKPSVIQPKRRNLRCRQAVTNDPPVKKGGRAPKKKHAAHVSHLLVKRDDIKTNILELTGPDTPKILTQETRDRDPKASIAKIPSENDSQELPADGLYDSPEYPSRVNVHATQQTAQNLLLNTDRTPKCNATKNRSDREPLKRHQRLPTKTRTVAMPLKRAVRKQIKEVDSSKYTVSKQEQSTNITQKSTALAVTSRIEPEDGEDIDILEYIPNSSKEEQQHSKRLHTTHTDVAAGISDAGAKRPATRKRKARTDPLKPQMKRGKQELEIDGDKCMSVIEIECTSSQNQEVPEEDKDESMRKTELTGSQNQEEACNSKSSTKPAIIPLTTETDIKTLAVAESRPRTKLLKPRRKRGKQALEKDGISVRETELLHSQNQEEVCNTETMERDTEPAIIPYTVHNGLQKIGERKDDSITTGISVKGASAVNFQEVAKDMYSKRIGKDNTHVALEKDSISTSSEPPAKDINFSSKEKDRKRSRRTVKRADIPRNPTRQKIKMAVNDHAKKDKHQKSLQTNESTKTQHANPPVSAESTVPGNLSQKPTTRLGTRRKAEAESLLEGGEKDACPPLVQPETSQSTTSQVWSPRSRQTRRTKKSSEKSESHNSTPAQSAVERKVNQSSIRSKKQSQPLAAVINSDMETDSTTTSGTVLMMSALGEKEPVNLPSDSTQSVQWSSIKYLIL